MNTPRMVPQILLTFLISAGALAAQAPGGQEQPEFVKQGQTLTREGNWKKRWRCTGRLCGTRRIRKRQTLGRAARAGHQTRPCRPMGVSLGACPSAHRRAAREEGGGREARCRCQGRSRPGEKPAAGAVLSLPGGICRFL